VTNVDSNELTAIHTNMFDLSANLPTLPSAIRYFDDFTDQNQSIRNLRDSNAVSIFSDGIRHNIDLSVFRLASTVVKHVLVDWFEHLDPTTVVIQMRSIQAYIASRGIDSFYHLILSTPFDARAHWNSFVLARVTAQETYALRAMLKSLCRFNIGYWRPFHFSIVTAMSSPKVDKYRVVRGGDCFLPLAHQAIIINHIDELCVVLGKKPADVTHTDLRTACLLVMSFQYAFRSGQMARIEAADVRLFPTGAVHISVLLTKQKVQQKQIRVNRRIKREWAPLFNELVNRRDAGDIQPGENVPPHLLFGLTPQGVSLAISKLTKDLTGFAWTPTDLRHTAAQRLADVGISHVALTEFMGQTSDRVANVYFDKSPAQAKRINEALAISPIYSNVAKVAETKTIDKAFLLGLPADQQIGAAPHAIPIAGIGGCDLGQSLCTKNPVLSCY